MLVVTVLLYQNSSRCDKKVWDIWDEGEATSSCKFLQRGTLPSSLSKTRASVNMTHKAWVVPQTIPLGIYLLTMLQYDYILCGNLEFIQNTNCIQK